MEDDESTYELKTDQEAGGPSDFDRAMMVQAAQDEEEVSSEKPSWAGKWEAQQKAMQQQTRQTRVKGTCVKWNKGWGFIKVEGAQDVYVHQRNIVKEGFRSLLEGEPVEFEYGTMADGKLEALTVTGPDGAEPEGQMHPDDREEAEAAKAASLKAQAAKEPRPKPYTAFVPRTVKRPGMGKPAPRPSRLAPGAASSSTAANGSTNGGAPAPDAANGGSDAPASVSAPAPG